MADQMVVARLLRAPASGNHDRKFVGSSKRRNLDEQSDVPRKRRSEVDLARLAAKCDLLAFACDVPSLARVNDSPETKNAATKHSAVCGYGKEVKDKRGDDANAWCAGGCYSSDDEGRISDSSSSSEDVCPVTGTGGDKDDINVDSSSPASGRGKENVWTPIAGPMSWVQQQMRAKVNPRSILKALLPNHKVIPEGVHDVMLWKIIVNILCDQPRRQKLDHFNTIDDIVSLIRTCNNIIVLTGAGVSVSCGIPDFRSRDGLYARISVEYPDLPDPQAIFDIQYFQHNPYPFFKFAKAIYPGRFTPSRSHRFIKLLEDRGKLLRNYSQNIDTLEKVAGIHNVIECHGSFAAATCTVCGHKVPCGAIKDDIMKQVIPRCPVCPASIGQRGIMKPDIVFFGESLPKIFHDHIAHDKDKCDLLIVIGSSLRVRPVALVPSCLPPGVPQVLINREPLPSHRFDVELLGDCDVIVSELCARLGEGWRLSNYSENSDLPMREVRPEALYDTADVGPDTPASSCAPASPGMLDSAVDASSPKSVAVATDATVDDMQSVMETSRGGSCDDMSLDGGPSPLPIPLMQPGPPRSRAGSNATVSMQSVNGDAVPANDAASLLDGFSGKINATPSTMPVSSSAALSPPPSKEHEDRLLSDRAEEYNQSGKTGLAALQERWLEKSTGPLSSRLSENTYLFLPPSRYVFPGAEVYSDESDNDDESDSDGTTVNDDQSNTSNTSDDDDGDYVKPYHFVPPEDEDAHDSFPENSSGQSASSSSSGSPSNSVCPFDPVSSNPAT